MSSPASSNRSRSPHQSPFASTQDDADEEIADVASRPRKRPRRVAPDDDDDEGKRSDPSATEGHSATQVKPEQSSRANGGMDMDPEQGPNGEQNGEGSAGDEEVIDDGNGLNLELSEEQQRKLAQRDDDG